MISKCDNAKDILFRHVNKLRLALEHPSQLAIVKMLRRSRALAPTSLEERSKSKSRHLRILDFPNELLMVIFDFVKGHAWIPSDLLLHEHIFCDVQSIKSLRLTCHRFHDLSSRLLLSHVRIDLTCESLAHFDEVSRHPFISKGIKAVTLSLAPFYDSFRAHSL
ncbi:hypothetical protein F4808DRAFT_460968 [Astrocystis sublimbata]|nr:hypothetical protein F4808DRAFT_460968 [Astrocystis sublimbata]